MATFVGYGRQHSPSTIPDAETRLRKSGTPIAATTSQPAKEIAVRHQTAFRLEIGCVAYSGFVANTNYWKIVLEASVDSVAANFKAIGETILAPRSPSDFAIRSAILTDGVTVESLAPGAEYLRCTAVKVGNPGPLDYNAYMAPFAPLAG